VATETIWRIPPALRVYLSGTEGYSGTGAHVQWLAGELRRLKTASELKYLPRKIRREIERTWLARIRQHISEPMFFEDLANAARLLAQPEHLPNAKRCLAEAYVVLAKPEGTQCFDPPDLPGPEIAFLETVGNQINTRTVRLYAERLFKEYCIRALGPENAQLLFPFSLDSAHVNWS
jgi:hypothetical protein